MAEITNSDVAAKMKENIERFIAYVKNSLAQKYGMDFDVVSLSINPGDTRQRLVACPANNKNLSFDVSVGGDPNNIEDNYILRYVFSDFEKAIASALEAQGIHSSARIQGFFTPKDRVDLNLSYNELLKKYDNDGILIRIIALEQEHGITTIQDTIKQLIANLAINCALYIYSFTEPEQYDLCKSLMETKAHISNSDIKSLHPIVQTVSWLGNGKKLTEEG